MVDFPKLLPSKTEYLQRFFEPLFEIRVLEEGKFRTVWSGIYDKWEGIKPRLKSYNKESNVYVCLNPLLEACKSKKTFNTELERVGKDEGIKDAEVREYRWLYIDIDPKRPVNGVAADDEEKSKSWDVANKVMGFLREQGFYEPVVCDSGNGFHIHYRIFLENTRESSNLLKNVLAALHSQFTNDFAEVDRKVFNAARITKLYGTVSRKGQNTEDRPHRKSGFISFPDDAENKINPIKLLEKIAKTALSPSSTKKEVYNYGFNVSEYLDKYGYEYWSEEKGDWTYYYFTNGCPFNNEHDRKDACIGQNISGAIFFKCLHNSCEGNDWAAFRRLDEPEYVSSTERAEELSALMDEIVPYTFSITEEISTEITEQQSKVKEEWKRVELELSDKGKVAQTTLNFAKVLRQDTHINQRVGFNEMTQCAMNMTTKKRWSDSDDARIFSYCETTYGLTKFESFQRAMSIRFDETRFHPIRYFLNSLHWDGVTRVRSALTECLGAEDSEYVQEASELMFVSAVARMLRPGCKYDNMVVLVGPQGCGKSTFIRRMAIDGDWFTDGARTVEGREAIEQIRGFWICEWGELTAMRRAKDAEGIKLFISQQVDVCREPYKRHVAEFPRQCVFIGTTNTPDFLTDHTGNRRFFPVTVEKGHPRIWENTEESTHYFSQLWAEALCIFKKGRSLTMPEGIYDAVHEVQSEHTQDDYREGVIQEWLDKNPEITRVCTKLIWDEVFLNSDKAFPKWDAICIGNIMDRMKGWEKSKKKQRFPVYGVQRSWVRCGVTQTLD